MLFRVWLVPLIMSPHLSKFLRIQCETHARYQRTNTEQVPVVTHDNLTYDDREGEVKVDRFLIQITSELHMKVIYTIVGVVGIVGNSFVFIVIVTNIDMRKTLTNLFILNQCAIDGIASVLTCFNGFFEDPELVPAGLARELFCKFWISRHVMWGFFHSSGFNLVVLTFERYIALVHPLIHMKSYTRTKAWVQMVLCWIFGQACLLIAGVPATEMQGDICVVLTAYPSRLIHMLAACFFFLMYFLPMVLITYCYIRIAWVLRTQKGSGGQDSSNKNRDELMMRARQNVLKMLCIVFVCFVICWSPNIFPYLLRNLDLMYIDYQGWFYHFSVALAFSNSVVNPFIYSIKYEEFRDAVKKKVMKKGST